MGKVASKVLWLVVDGYWLMLRQNSAGRSIGRELRPVSWVWGLCAPHITTTVMVGTTDTKVLFLNRRNTLM